MSPVDARDQHQRFFILHVEDDPNDAFLVRHALQKAAPDAGLFVVTDGREAQSYLRGEGIYTDRTQHPFPDVVLLDLKLPKMTGLEVLEWMKSRQELAALPVFILSSSSEKSDLERAHALGVSLDFHTALNDNVLSRRVADHSSSEPIAQRTPSW